MEKKIRSDETDTVSLALVKLGLGIRQKDITPAARRAARRLILDTMGCMLAGWNQPGVRPLLDTLVQLGTDGPCTIPVIGKRARLDDAVTAASLMAHALDYDDVHCEACLHLMCKLLPAVLLTGQVCHADGEAVLEAVIAGMEVGARIGRHFNSFSFLNSNIAGGFGVTAALCRLMKLSEEQSVHAMGIYYSRASGNRQALLEAAMVKRIQPAFAAQSAVWAVMLAGNGLTGARQVFEGGAGLFEAYCRGAKCPSAEEFLKQQPFLEIERSSIKSFPTCGSHHGAVMAAMDLRKRHAFTLEEIERLDIFLMEAMRIVGNDFVISEHPQINAQFSAAYAVAAALLRDEVVLDMFSDEAISGNEDIARLAARAHMYSEYDGALPDEYPGHIMRIVRVRLKNGTTYEEMRPNNPSALYPDRLSDREVDEKFRGCARFSGICNEERCERLIVAIRSMEKCRDIGSWMEENFVFEEAGRYSLKKER